MSAGGRIKQTIVADKSSKDSWDFDRSILFNFQILNCDSFTRVTGLSPPSTPITVAAYAAYGFPYYKIYDEVPSGVHGDFKGLKSVNETDRTKNTQDALRAIQEVSKSTVNPTIGYTWDDLRRASGQQKRPFNHISDLQALLKNFHPF